MVQMSSLSWWPQPCFQMTVSRVFKDFYFEGPDSIVFEPCVVGFLLPSDLLQVNFCCYAVCFHFFVPLLWLETGALRLLFFSLFLSFVLEKKSLNPSDLLWIRRLPRILHKSIASTL